MWSCDQSLVTLAFISEKYYFFEGWSWFKFNNLRLGPGMVLKFYTSVAKRLKLKVKKFLGLIPTFVEVTGKKLFGSIFRLPHHKWVYGFFLSFKFHNIGARLDELKYLDLLTCWNCHVFWRVFNIPSNWLYVINSHRKHPKKICSENKISETYKLLEKHQTTFTMIWSYTCVILHVTYTYLRLVRRKASVWGYF